MASLYDPSNETMIEVTRLNGQRFTINAIYIEQAQATPDTVITLTNGKKFVVKESMEELTQLVTQFYRRISILGIEKDVEGS